MTEPNDRPHLLFLCHRIPYPPNKGDKIRSFHLLQALAAHYQVHLGGFVDDADDRRYERDVAGYCRSCRFVPLSGAMGKLRGLRGFVTGQALSLPYYHDRRMRRWVEETWERFPVSRIVVFSSAMAQYVMDRRFDGARRVIDFVDVDSDKWRQYARSKPRRSAWLFRREGERLEAYDKAVARAFDVSLFVSPEEAALFRRLLGDERVRVEQMVNGVDTAYFSPDPGRASPFPPGRRTIVFTGAMDYWANVDAVCWFCREVLPTIRRRSVESVFYIVGSHPDEAVRRLASEGVVVTGAVPDVRPYLQHADSVVAPMQIARGIQNKVLEAMSMARPVVVTSKGLEGIGAVDGEQLLVADGAAVFAQKLSGILEGDEPGLGGKARDYCCRVHGWEASLQGFLDLLEG
jgi:sugar transferase (PEP-CTERM/EpsH1 system associated)